MSAHTSKFLLAALATTAIVALPVAMRFNAPSMDAYAASPIVDASSSMPGSFSHLVQQNRQAVVTVKVAARDGAHGKSVSSPMPEFGPNSQFKDFFDKFLEGRPGMPNPDGRGAPKGHLVQGLGSGFIIDPSGLIVTNNHVIEYAQEITVTLDDGTELPATLVGRDAKTDLAVVKVMAEQSLPTVAWGDSDSILAGDWVIAIGNPFGLGGTVTAGIVSAHGRDLHSGPYDDFIQVDAAINRGNSGGPLFDMNGNVIGVNSVIYSPNGGNIGLGFAIPSNLAKSVVAKLATDGHIERGYLGVSIQPVTGEIAEAMGIDEAKGALVAEVTPGSPAAKAGIQPGDVITTFADQEIDDARDLSRVVADVSPNENQTLTLMRDGNKEKLDVIVGAMPGEQTTAVDVSSDPTETETGALGLALSDLTSEMRKKLNLSDGDSGALVVKVDPDKAAAEAGIEEGDVIVGVGQIGVKSAGEAVKEIKKAEADGHKNVLLLVQHDGQRTYVAVGTATS